MAEGRKVGGHYMYWESAATRDFAGRRLHPHVAIRTELHLRGSCPVWNAPEVVARGIQGLWTVDSAGQLLRLST